MLDYTTHWASRTVTYPIGAATGTGAAAAAAAATVVTTGTGSGASVSFEVDDPPSRFPMLMTLLMEAANRFRTDFPSPTELSPPMSTTWLMLDVGIDVDVDVDANADVDVVDSCLFF